MDFEEYLDLQYTSFVQYYRCRAISLLGQGSADDNGNRTVMPPSALDRLSQLNIAYPMMFKIQNPATEQSTHCGVLEFVAEEGFIHVPTWMMARLGLGEDDLVLITSTSLPKAKFLKLQPHTKNFLEIKYPREVLEYNFQKSYALMSVGHTIKVMNPENEKEYSLDVVEARPADGVCTWETDCAVDFTRPLDYNEPPPLQLPETAGQGAAPQEPVRFAGVGVRMDGMAVEQLPPPPVTAGSSGKGKTSALRFGGPPVAVGAAKKDAKKVDDTEAKRFAGQKYSLGD